MAETNSSKFKKDIDSINYQLMSHSHSQAEIYDRLGKLDRESATLSVGQENLTDQVTKMAQGIDLLAKEMRAGFAEASKAKQTNWGTLAAVGTLIILVISGYFGLIANNAQEARDENRDRIVALASAVNEHTSNGHPYTVIEKTNANRKANDNNAQEIKEILEWIRQHEVKSGSTNATQSQAIAEIQRRLNTDLAANTRFTKHDFEKLVEPIIREHALILSKTAERLAKLEALLERVLLEQEKRTSHVYSKS